ncbi:D-alanyl-D-alanine carboxypeptidase/D-alanyl-D-alanine-endopeptidase [Neisseriaceae bacterium CLB008]
MLTHWLTKPQRALAGAATLLALTVSLPAQALNFGQIPQPEIGIYVQDLRSNQIVYQHNAHKPFNPASTMKLVTTFAALDKLGPDYVWPTFFRSNAPIENGVLKGDLYWQGSGDAVFDQKDLQAMQAQLLMQGIHQIDGNLVFDRSVWQTMGSAEGFANDAKEAFTTPPDPQMVAYKVAWLNVKADANGQPTLDMIPALPSVTLSTDLKPSTATSCLKLKNFLSVDTPTDTEVLVKGSLPPSCIGSQTYVNVIASPMTFAHQSFLANWAQLGGQNTPILMNGKTPQNARILAAHASAPLKNVIQDMNKASNNVIARTLYLTLGAHPQAQADTATEAENKVRQSLSQHHVGDRDFLILENGSGLSRKERLTPRLMGDLLQQAYNSSFKQDFIDSLPAAGAEGTLKTRFKELGSPLRLKTGTLSNVRALAGFWLPTDPSQKPLGITVVINSPNATRYIEDMDALVQELIGQYGS